MVEEHLSEVRFLDELMNPPSTVSAMTDNRLLRDSEYKRRTLSKATIQSIVGSNKSSIDRMLAYAFRTSSGTQEFPILASTFKESGSEEVLPNEKKTPNAEDDIAQGRLFLEQKGNNNISVWSHLNDMLRKILSERPDNVIEYFEEYSRQVKQERFAEQSGFIRDVFMPPEQLEYSKRLLGLVEGYAVEDEVEDVATGEEEEGRRSGKRKMDLMEAAYYFSEGGVHLPDSELFAVNVAMKNFVQERGVLNPRFWGKVYGSKSNYFIIECQLPEDEAARRNEEEEADEIAKEEQLKTEQEEAFREKEEAEKIANEEEDNYWLEIEMEEAKAEEERLMKEEEERLLKEEEERVAAEQSPEEDDKKEELGEEEQEPAEGGETNINDDNIEPSMLKEEFLNVTTANEEPTNEVGENLEPAPPVEDPLLPPLPPPKKILTYKIPLTMKPPPKPEIKIPVEKYGEGVNKKVFFACTEPGEEWIELPKVTPKQIIASRQLKIYFTGNLNAKIDSYPEFPGTESDYLRAQIARISAGTQVSPLGFYSFSEGGEEEEEEEVEEEEEEGDRNTYVENSSFEPIPIKDLVDPSLAFWVHHTQHILKQGRAIFWSTKKPPSGEEDEEEAEAEEEEDEKDKEEKEVGPPLLTPLSEDASLEAITPWTVRKSSNYNQACAIAFIKSNLWPGAYAFAVEKKFENIYIGNGHKYSSQGFSPTMLPHPEYEYLLGPEIMEINDPSVEIEEAWRVKHKKKPPPKPEEEGEEEEEAGEEEEEEDDE